MPAAAVRLGVLLAYRELQNPAIAQFLDDADPYLAREAAEAINDAPVESRARAAGRATRERVRRTMQPWWSAR